MGKSNTVTPNALAASLSKRLGRTITAKMVRSVARESLSAYDKARHPAYQSHEYGADAVRVITARFEARSGRTTKPTTKPHKARKSPVAPTTTATA